MDIFDYTSQKDTSKPLAEGLRPKNWDSFFGIDGWPRSQQKLLSRIKQQGFLPNLILWGPPGTGKTTFALLLQEIVKNSLYLQVNAVDTGAKKLKEIGLEAKNQKRAFGKQTVLFIDEIHRLNKAQQDVLLPFSEQGDFTLIGATTENPSYELNSALLSRCQVLTFHPLSAPESKKVLSNAADFYKVELSELVTLEATEILVMNSQGDMRSLLNTFEQIYQSYINDKPSQAYGPEDLGEIVITKKMSYDGSGDEHYNTTSALIKSIRGSDPDASLYYLARMVHAGESPVFIARRLVVSASEDIGNADPRALTIAVAGLQAVELVGLPEAGINLAQVVTYLASAPKSNKSYLGWKKALEVVGKTGSLPIPKALRSAQTRLAKSLGFGYDYKYTHNRQKGYIKQDFLPQEIKTESFYEPSSHGFEKKILEYLKWLKS